MVLTSHGTLGNTCRKTGFWLKELAAPYYTFKDAAIEITLASLAGGQPPLDPKSNEPSFQAGRPHRSGRDAATTDRCCSPIVATLIRQLTSNATRIIPQ
jgi:putative intracellular protease/amidase